MLKKRLIFGTLMTAFFIAVNILDGWLDGSISTAVPDAKLQGSLLCILIALLMVPAQIELSKLVQKTNAKVFTPVTIIGSILLATGWYWCQLAQEPLGFCIYYFIFAPAFLLLAIFLYHGLFFGTAGVIANCGANLLCVFYLGFLSSFVLGLRIEFGLWPLLMFIFTVKFADIGAFAVGSVFGKHKFSPKISPGKTWEGMAGAVVFAVIVSSIFAAICDIMGWQLAVVFGTGLAFIGQLGDLVESMIKRDAEQKDSSNNVPGFGGVLDVIDSPLVAASFAYLFFTLI